MAKPKKDKKGKKTGVDFNDLSKRLGGLIGFIIALGFSIWVLMLMWDGVATSWPW